MKKTILIYLVGASLFVSTTTPISAQPPKSDPDAAIAVIQKMLASIRLKKFDHALTYIHIDEIAKFLTGQHYKKFSPSQKQQLNRLLGDYIKIRAFPLAVKYIGDVGLTYDRPVTKNGKFYLKSSVVYSSKERIVFSWVLQEYQESLLITDFIDIENKSSMTKSRDQQVLPSLNKRGIKGFLENFEKVVNKLKS